MSSEGRPEGNHKRFRKVQGKPLWDQGRYPFLYQRQIRPEAQEAHYTQPEKRYIQIGVQNHIQTRAQNQIPTRPQFQVRGPLPTQTSDTQRDFLENFSFDGCKRGNQGFQRLLLQLFGYAGHGKSSFINTCKTVWDEGPYQNYTKASGSYGGDTTARRTYPLTENIIMVDNRGSSAVRSHETGEIYAQLANLLPLDREVSWCKGFRLADRLVEAEPLVRYSDFIAPIFIYSATFSPNPEEIADIKEILKNCRNMTGVEATIVITHKSKGDVSKTHNMFKDMIHGDIFSLENYTPNNVHKSPEVHQLVMRFLHTVVKGAEFRVNDPRDAESEMRQRKVFVLTYIHNKDLEEHQREIERKHNLESAKLEQKRQHQKEEAEKQQRQQQQEHEERMKRMEEEFERQRLRDQYEHERKIKPSKKKKDKKKMN